MTTGGLHESTKPGRWPFAVTRRTTSPRAARARAGDPPGSAARSPRKRLGAACTAATSAANRGGLSVLVLLLGTALSVELRARADPPRAPQSDTHSDAPSDTPGGRTGTEAPTPDDEPPRSGWAALPVVTFSPETQLGVGAFAAHFFRLEQESTRSRPSSLAAVALVTTREQAIFELIQELYWDDERWRFWTKADYRHYPNAFWGTGNDAPEASREWYLSSGPRIQTQIRRQLVGAFFLELRGDAEFLRNSDFLEGGLLATGRIPGARSGRVVGVGPTILLDTRNHLLVPREGGFYELSYMQFHGFLGGEFDFAKMVANLRRFMPAFQTHVIAVQLYLEASMGNTPFHRLALIGGQRLLRGYFEGRFRDRYLMASQVEYRMPLFWRLGAVAFLGAGAVAPTLGTFALRNSKWSLGGGLRFRLNEAERLNLRADVGLGLFDSWGLYVGIAEAF